MRQILTLFTALLFLKTGYSQDINIVPQPAELTASGGAPFVINKNTVIVAEDAGMDNSIRFFNDYLQQLYGFSLKVSKKKNTAGIHLRLKKIDNPIAGAYYLDVTNKGIDVTGDNENGVFYGMQTLLQLLPVEQATTFNIPAVKIKDYPRFEYRGMHLDVSRHFFSVDFVKKYIDYLALHKLNYFHWHLTDDQGWRIEIKKYPKLTTVGGFRNGTIIGRYPGKGNDNIYYGGYYTQEQVKEVVAYAAQRYITVVPEIEMPGHASAALTAYPYLGCTGGPYQVQQTWGVFNEVFCAGNDSVFNFLQDVLDEVMPLFPAKYIHLGGDECPKESWKKCPKCQQRMKTLNLKDEHELQSYFVQRMEKYVNSKGKTMIGWDEILEGGLAPNAVVMSWRGEKGGIEAAKQKHKVIMTPTSYMYFDYSQSKNEDSVTIGGYVPIEKVYSYEPISKELSPEEGKYVLGAQANLWTEYIGYPSKVEYTIFPRLSALSEVLWSPKEKRNWAEFEKKLMIQYKRYDRLNINYSRAYFDLKATIMPTPTNQGVLWYLETNSREGKILHPTSSSDTTLVPYTQPLVVVSDVTLFATMEVNGKRTGGIKQQFSFNKATGKKISITNKPADKYAGQLGAFGLINGARSAKDINSPEWLGWEGGDMEASIDLLSSQNISNVSLHVLEQKGSWIYLPGDVEVQVSDNGKDFRATDKNIAITKEAGTNMGNISISFSPVTTRFVKVIARNYGIIPDGQPGAGNRAWLFVDEIAVN
ncbi:MAG: beta-N-acetylhexosaminidase [Chitinophagaceae bacterium]